MGNRVYTIDKSKGNGIAFTMTEKIEGPIFPLFAKYIPPFDESFERFAADLKKEAKSFKVQKVNAKERKKWKKERKIIRGS